MAAPPAQPLLVDAYEFLKGLNLEELNLRPFEKPMISNVIVVENPEKFHFPQYRMSIDEVGFLYVADFTPLKFNMNRKSFVSTL